MIDIKLAIGIAVTCFTVSFLAAVLPSLFFILGIEVAEWIEKHRR